MANATKMTLFFCCIAVVVGMATSAPSRHTAIINDRGVGEVQPAPMKRFYSWEEGKRASRSTLERQWSLLEREMAKSDPSWKRVLRAWAITQKKPFMSGGGDVMEEPGSMRGFL